MTCVNSNSLKSGVQKKQAEKFGDLVSELNQHGQQGWELIGVHSFDLVGGITGANKGKANFTVWKREVGN